MDEFGLLWLSLVWFDEVDFLKCSRSASQLSFTNLFKANRNRKTKPATIKLGCKMNCFVLTVMLQLRKPLSALSSPGHSNPKMPKKVKGFSQWTSALSSYIYQK